jgi:hypothetical protein
MVTITIKVPAEVKQRLEREARQAGRLEKVSGTFLYSGDHAAACM